MEVPFAPVIENWVRIQRLLILSYWTIGSPSLFVAQPPPRLAQIALPAMGRPISAPVVLLKTAYAVFTHWTYCVAPTAPIVSGGAQQPAPAPHTPTPSKLRPLVVATAGPAVVWRAPSGWFGLLPGPT